MELPIALACWLRFPAESDLRLASTGDPFKLLSNTLGTCYWQMIGLKNTRTKIKLEVVIVGCGCRLTVANSCLCSEHGFWTQLVQKVSAEHSVFLGWKTHIWVSV